MSLEDCITWVFCWVDDSVKKIIGDQKLRKRGFQPALTDAEVITMEVVGEFVGFDTDKAIWSYFKEHWSNMFPSIGSRSQFAKQAANLHLLKVIFPPKNGHQF